MVVDGQRHVPAALHPGMKRYPLHGRLGGPPVPVWTGAENLAPSRIRSSDGPARSESLFRPTEEQTRKQNNKEYKEFTENYF